MKNLKNITTKKLLDEISSRFTQERQTKGIDGVQFGENAVLLLTGEILCFQQRDDDIGTEYVRFVDPETGDELLRYDSVEWSGLDATEVMGAIMTAITGGCK